MSIDSKVEQMSMDVMLFPENAARSFSRFTKSVSNYVFSNVYYYLNLYKRKSTEREQGSIQFAPKLENENIPSDKKAPSEFEKACIQFAIKLEKDQRLHALFGFLDGISIASGTLGYIFSLIYLSPPKLAPKRLHEWSVTPLGIAVIILETLLMIALSVIANCCKATDDKSLTNQVKKWIIDYWSYARDILKAAKNSYRGFRNVLQAIVSAGGTELTSIIMPVTIVLAIVTIAARVYIRIERTKQKKSNDEIEKLLKTIKKAIGAKEVFDAVKIQGYRNIIKENTLKSNYLFFLATGLNGFVDSLYLYIGVASVVTLSCPVMPVCPVILVIVLSCSVAYAVVCIVSRLYEEYDKLRRFEACVAHIELILLGKEFANKTEELLEQLNITNIALSEANGLREEQAKLDAELRNGMTESQSQLLDRLSEIDTKLANYKEETLRATQKALCLELKNYVIAFESKHKELYARTILSNFSAFFEGVKNGLAVYGMLCAGLFAFSTVGTVVLSTAVTCPPVLFYICASFGLVMIIYFGCRAWVDYSRHRNKVTNVVNPPQEGLSSVLKTLKETDQPIKTVSTMKHINFESYTDLAQIPENNVQAWFENFRAGVSGAPKSFKGWGFALTWLQTEGADGYYHDSSIATILGLIFMPLYMVTLGLRAHAKGFCKKKVSAESALSPADELAIISNKTKKEEFLNFRRLKSMSNEESDSSTALPLPAEPKELEKPTSTPVIAKQNSPKPDESILGSSVARLTRSFSMIFSGGFFSVKAKPLTEKSHGGLSRSFSFFGSNNP